MGAVSNIMVKRNFQKNPVTHEELINSYWYVVVDDSIGGWTISTVDKPTSQINPYDNEFELGMYMMKESAEHVAKLHNDWLEIQIWSTYMPNIEWSFKNSV